MTTSKKNNARQELENIEDALVQSILDTSDDELRSEIIESGGDPDACITSVEQCLDSARSKIGKERLDEARTKLTGWRGKSGNVTDIERARAQKKLQQVRGGDSDLDSKMMLAARKGEGLAECDLEGLLEDMAELERLEREDGDE